MDLDGTIVHDGVVASEDMKAVKKVMEMGVHVIPATTRMRFSAYRLISKMELTDKPLVCLNGAMVTGPGWERGNGLDIWMERRLDMTVAKSISVYADEQGYDMTTIFGEKKYWKERRDLAVIGQYEDPIARYIKKNTEALVERPISYMIHAEINGREGLLDIEKFVLTNLKDKTCLHRHHRLGELKALTIYADGTSKLKGIEIVCERLGISLDETMAIGDDEVDMDMLSGAGIGIAMGNSPEYVKKVADLIVPSCTEGGVAHALQEVFEF